MSSCRGTVVSLSLLALASTAAIAGPAVDIAVRQSVLDKNALQKPAQFQITSPEEGETSYSVDAGVSLTFATHAATNSLWDFSVSGEFHRNNLTDKEQDSLLGTFTVLGVVGDLSVQSWSLFPQFSAGYKSDEVKNTKSMLWSGDVALASKAIGAGKILGPLSFGFLWQPRIGLEYEDIVEAKDDGPTGSVGRWYAVLDVAVFPARAALNERLTLAFFYQEWGDFSESDAINDGRDNHHLSTVGATYYFDTNSHFGLALERIDGENPTKGLPDQEYDRLSFKVKF